MLDIDADFLSELQSSTAIFFITIESCDRSGDVMFFLRSALNFPGRF